ncbi:MAG: PKD domain-containing protein, partial [bacterium]
MINFLGLFLLLISQTESFTYLSTCPVPGSPREGRVYGDYAYIATSNGGLSIVNVSNVNSPFLVGSCNLSGNSYCLRVVDTIAYVGTADNFTGL